MLDESASWKKMVDWCRANRGEERERERLSVDARIINVLVTGEGNITVRGSMGSRSVRR